MQEFKSLGLNCFRYPAFSVGQIRVNGEEGVWGWVGAVLGRGVGLQDCSLSLCTRESNSKMKKKKERRSSSHIDLCFWLRFYFHFGSGSVFRGVTDLKSAARTAIVTVAT